jgi:Tol biopolymer transport system component
MKGRTGSFTALAVALVALGSAAPAHAQYFGRNPVQWERLKFEVLQTAHFDIHYYPEGKEAAEQAARMAERWYARLSRILGHQFRTRQPLILYASHPHFQQTNTIGGAPGEGTGGVTEAFKRRIVLPVGASLEETDHVLGHELVHAFQYDMTGQGRVSSTNVPGALRMPLWFIEGMAEYLSVGPVDPHTSMWLRDAARKEKLPTVRDLSNPKYFPYRFGQALWAYIAGRYGERVFAESLRKIGPRTNDAETVLKEVLGIDDKALSKDWHAAIRDAYAQAVAGKKRPSEYGPALVTEKGQGGTLNVAPALSPEGKKLAFLSERELFSVELFVADTTTGDVTKRLSHTVVDPHLESLQFIASAGAWDRSGKRIALGAVSKGRPLLVILDAESGKKLEEIPFPTLGEITTPTFSPDGQKVAFAALVNGFSDLFVYDLGSKSLKRITDDAFADLQPAWSPDGRRIAFVTDRYTTKVEMLATGNYRLASADPVSGELTPLPSFPRAKNINPQWASTGQSLYFVSDAAGVSNIYRVDLANGTSYQVTDLAGGVSGITALSPALSSAAAVNRLAYSAYEDGNHEIYTIEQAERLAGWPVPLDDDARAGLIPGGKPQGMVVEALAQPEAGLPPAQDYPVKPYKAKLGLDYVGQPYVAAGVDRYGAVFGGGISMSFSDMLGEHNLNTVIQANSVAGFNDVGGIVAYVNRTRRFNWGVQVAQVPYVTGGFANGPIRDSSGRILYVEQTLIQREIDRSVGAIGFYPFDQSLRVEMQASARRISFDTRLRTDTFTVGGDFLGTQEEELPDSEALNLYEGSAALVRDTSLFGATSPILGQRFRMEVSPTAGSVNYTGVLADFRQYVMPVRPVTLAGRVMHFGRYGGGGEDPRLFPLFLGYASLVRGYDNNSFEPAECGQQSDGSCPPFDSLLGSRLLVANIEVRAPLLGLFGARRLYGPLPIEIGAFFDAGVAWDSASKPKLFGGERELVRSVGGTARVNVLGFAVLQIDYAKPLDRPGKKAFFQFNLLAGF